MSKCRVLGTRKQRGNHRSHANNAVKRDWKVNVFRKKYTLASGQTVRLTLSARAIRSIDKNGPEYLEKMIKKIEEKE